MTYTPPEGVTIGTFTADTLPASFNAPADAVLSYKIYGTSEGVGIETENLVEGIIEGANIDDSGVIIANAAFNMYVAKIVEGQEYTITSVSGFVYGFFRTFPAISSQSYDNSRVTGQSTFTAPIDGYIAFRAGLSDTLVMLTPGSTAPAYYVPPGYKVPFSLTDGTSTSTLNLFIGDSKLGEDEYVDYTTQKIYKLQEGVLTPTDPPLPLPSIITYDGENTISSTETLGDVELTGDWTAIMGSTEEESIDIGFTVDADSFIAFVTVNDSSIQVFDTITMPSSAGSFTLHVVSWGREPYTDTVYNALL